MSWIDDLQPGDKVIVNAPRRAGVRRARLTEGTVDRLLIKHVVVDGQKYNRVTGHAPSKSAWDPTPWISPYDPAVVAAAKEVALRGRLWAQLRRNVTGDEPPETLTTDQLRQLVATTNPPQQEAPQ